MYDTSLTCQSLPSEEYLRNFITKNSELSRMLHEYRGY